MATLTLANGDTFFGPDAAALVTAYKNASPFTADDTNQKFIGDMLPAIRGALPRRNFRIPDTVVNDPHTFLRLLERAKMASYQPSAAETGSNGNKATNGFAGAGDPAAPIRRNSIPTDLAQWPVVGAHRLLRLPSGLEYRLTQTVTGWHIAAAWDGSWTYLDARGREKTVVPKNAPQFDGANAAIYAAQLHAAATVG